MEVCPEKSKSASNEEMLVSRCNMRKCPFCPLPTLILVSVTVFLSVTHSDNVSLSTYSNLPKSAVLLPVLSSVFLGKIKEAFDRDAELQNLLLDNFFSNAVQDCQVKTVLRKQPQPTL